MLLNSIYHEKFINFFILIYDDVIYEELLSDCTMFIKVYRKHSNLLNYVLHCANILSSQNKYLRAAKLASKCFRFSRDMLETSHIVAPALVILVDLTNHFEVINHFSERKLIQLMGSIRGASSGLKIVDLEIQLCYNLLNVFGYDARVMSCLTLASRNLIDVYRWDIKEMTLNYLIKAFHDSDDYIKTLFSRNMFSLSESLYSLLTLQNVSLMPLLIDYCNLFFSMKDERAKKVVINSFMVRVLLTPLIYTNDEGLADRIFTIFNDLFDKVEELKWLWNYMYPVMDKRTRN
jgi:hypothetical protein